MGQSQAQPRSPDSQLSVFLHTTSNLHTVDSDASSHSLGTWSLSKRRRGVARTPQPQAPRAGCLPLSFPRRRENWPEPQQFLFQGRASWCLPTPSTSLAGNRVQSQHQLQQGQSHPGSCWSHRESQKGDAPGRPQAPAVSIFPDLRPQNHADVHADLLQLLHRCPPVY